MKKLIVVINLLLSVSILFAQNQLTINGKVTDATNQPITSASIFITATMQATVTDMEGNYSLQVENRAGLIFSFM